MAFNNMDFNQLIEAFTHAVEARDGTRLAGLFTGTGVYHDTFYGEFEGREAIRAMLEERFHRDAEHFLWEMEKAVCDGETGYASWTFSYTSIQQGSAGKRVVFQGMSRFDLEDGLIRRYSEKFDSGMALMQLDFPPGRMAKLFTRWNGPLARQPALQRHFKRESAP